MTTLIEALWEEIEKQQKSAPKAEVTFGTALNFLMGEATKEDSTASIYRKSMPKGHHIFLCSLKKMSSFLIYVDAGKEKLYPYTPTSEDLLATDWVMDE